MNTQFKKGHKQLLGAGFPKGNTYGRANVGNTYGKVNKGRKAPWAKPPKNFGDKNINWKGGTGISSGYLQLLRPKHPSSHKTGYITRYRLIAELCLGRYLTRREVIHHINGKTFDDKLENLYFFPESTAHSAYHCLLKYRPDLVNKITKSNLPSPTPEAMKEIQSLLQILGTPAS